MQYKTIIICFLLLFSLNVKASFPWLEYESLKITIETGHILYEWEYENPSSFEFEKGDQIIRGEEAKKSFEQVLSIINISKPTISDEIIHQLEETHSFSNIRKVVVYSTDRDGFLKTWLWNTKD